jgi:2-methylisocitrate lyase-like PEP mutase family enzyme
MDEAITRLKLAADVGADVCFIEGVRTKELLERTVKALKPTPVGQSIFRHSIVDLFAFVRFS